MSIYKGNRGWNGLNDEVASTRPRMPAVGFMAPSVATQDWSSVRKAMPADFLLPSSARWFQALPSDRKPRALASANPRIVNQIAAQWHEAHGPSRLFEELLHDRRGGRAGFSAAVRDDLNRLQEHWYGGTTRLGTR
jgi:hypothetical protein